MFLKKCKNMSTKQEIVSDAAFKARPFLSNFNFACKNSQVVAATCKYYCPLLCIGCKPYHQVAKSSILNEAEF